MTEGEEACQRKSRKQKEEALKSYVGLLNNINRFKKSELYSLLKEESSNNKRSAIIKRLKERIIGITIEEVKRDLEKY